LKTNLNHLVIIHFVCSIKYAFKSESQIPTLLTCRLTLWR